MSTIRLVLVSAFALGVGLVIACGSSSSADGSSGASSGATSGGVGGSACDPTAANACGNNNKCDPTLGCVQCTADTDCTASGRDPFCILGRCEACRTNTDCGVAAPACYPGDHQCHRSCVGDGGARCTGNAPICDQATGACIGCNAPTDCPATTPICEPTTKSCVTCTTNAECPATRPRCRVPAFQCVECLVNADCGAGRVCDGENRCEEAGCTSDQQCTNANRPKCNVQTGQCLECLGPADCAAVAGRPICSTGGGGGDGNGGERGRCVQCTTSAECGDGGTPICRNNACVQCVRDTDCPGQNANCDNNQCN